MSYSDLSFTEAEALLIENAWVDGVLEWSAQALLPIRNKIRMHHRQLQGDSCCYCRKDFSGDHALSCDIEHVLPKAVFKQLAISDYNLSVVCKRCNMIIKKARTDFLSVDVLVAVSLGDRSDTYKIVHPNLDVYGAHIQPFLVNLGTLKYRRYRIASGSEKGEETVSYFKLRELEIGELNAIQGVDREYSEDDFHNALLGVFEADGRI